MTKLNKTRVQLDMTPREIERMESLIVDTNAHSRAEVIRRAVAVYSTLIGHTKEGHTIVVERGGSRRRVEIEFPY